MRATTPLIVLALPRFRPDMSFDEACRAALEFLHTAIPMGYWSVSRNVAGRQLYLEVVDGAYGTVAGDSHAWSDSLCQHMVTGSAPQIAPDAMAVPKYAESGIAQELPIGAYVGIPIHTADGEVFGTLCGLDPEVKGVDLFAEASTLRQVGDLLSRFLNADLEKTRLERENERVSLAEVASRLVTRPFWEATLAGEEPRLRRFGDPAAVVAVAVHPDDLDAAAVTLQRVTRASDVVAVLDGCGFGLLARDIKPAHAVALVARIDAAFVVAGIAASVTHRDVDIQEGLAAAWENVSPRVSSVV